MTAAEDEPTLEAFHAHLRRLATTPEAKAFCEKLIAAGGDHVSELVPCALCGNTLMDTGNPDGLFPAGRTPLDGWIARCGNPVCGMEVIGDTKADAIARWNRRTPFDRAPETSRRQAAVSLLLSMGYQWRGAQWIKT